MASVAEIFEKAKGHLRAIAGDTVAVIKKGQDKLDNSINALETTIKNKKTDTSKIESNLKDVEAAVKNNKQNINLSTIETTLKEVVQEVKGITTEINVETDLTKLEELIENNGNTTDIVNALAEVQREVNNITFPEIKDNSEELNDIKEAVLSKTNTKIEELLTQLNKKDTTLNLPDVFPVDLDPNLIENNRVKTSLPEEQVAAMSSIIAQGGDNKSVFLLDGEGKRVDSQAPLATDGDSVYTKDVKFSISDIGTFTGDLESLFNNLDNVITDSTSTNPKWIEVKLERPMTASLIGINSGVGEFSNVKILLQNRQDQTIRTIDDTTNNTKYSNHGYSFTPTTFCCFRIEFHTNDAVQLSGIFLPKELRRIVRAQALDRETGVLNNIWSKDGALAVIGESNDTKPIDFYLSQAVGIPKFLGADTVVNDYEIEMTTGHGLIAGDEILIAENGDTPRSYNGKVLSVATDVLTMDTPVDTVFSAVGAIVIQTTKEMTIDGETTVQKFDIPNSSDVEFHITRIILHITGDSEMDDAKFGNLTALDRGIVFRQKFSDGSYNNIFNVKNNGEFGELAYDLTYQDAAKHGTYGLHCRMSFGSVAKHGTVLRIGNGEALELLVQDNLEDLDSFRIMVQGHFGLPPLS